MVKILFIGGESRETQGNTHQTLSKCETISHFSAFLSFVHSFSRRVQGVRKKSGYISVGFFRPQHGSNPVTQLHLRPWFVLPKVSLWWTISIDQPWLGFRKCDEAGKNTTTETQFLPKYFLAVSEMIVSQLGTETWQNSCELWLPGPIDIFSLKLLGEKGQVPSPV